MSAFDQQGLIVRGDVEVAEKFNEIRAAQALIEYFGLRVRVLRMDALHCKKLLALALERQADALVQVKCNRPTLLAALVLSFVCFKLARTSSTPAAAPATFP